jgi:threonine/homoserine/homoserine lactone efflux protein
MLYVLARSLQGGRREGIRSALGNGIGTLTHALVAAVGLSAVLAASAVTFTAVKLAGAAYLAFLGIQAIRTRRRGLDDDTAGRDRRRPSRSALKQGVVVELLNPKTALYFIAVLPHFVHPERAAAAVVLAVLGVVVVATVVSADLTVALVASRLHDRLANSSHWQIRQRVASGALLIGLSAYVAFA